MSDKHLIASPSGYGTWPPLESVEQAQSIFYILQHSTLILPVGGEGRVLLRLLLLLTVVGENKKHYIITALLSGMFIKFRSFRPISFIFLTYVLLTYFVRLHCTNIHIHLPSFSFLMT